MVGRPMTEVLPMQPGMSSLARSATWSSTHSGGATDMLFTVEEEASGIGGPLRSNPVSRTWSTTSKTPVMRMSMLPEYPKDEAIAGVSSNTTSPVTPNFHDNRDTISTYSGEMGVAKRQDYIHPSSMRYVTKLNDAAESAAMKSSSTLPSSLAIGTASSTSKAPPWGVGWKWTGAGHRRQDEPTSTAPDELPPEWVDYATENLERERRRWSLGERWRSRGRQEGEEMKWQSVYF